MRQVLKKLLPIIAKQKVIAILALLCTLIGVPSSLLVPILIGKAVDCAIGIGEVDYEGLYRIVIIFITVILLSTLFQWLTTLCVNRLAYGSIRTLRMQAIEKIESLPLSTIDSHARGDMMARVIADIETISDGLLQGFAQLFSGTIQILGTLILMLTSNIPITLIVVLLTPLSLLVASSIAKVSHSSFQRQSAVRGKMGGLAEEMLGNLSLVKSFGYEEESLAQFTTLNEELASSGAKATFCASLSNPTTRFVNGIIYAAVGACGALGVCGYLPWVGTMSIGGLVSFLSYANQYTKPFNEISGVIAELQNAISCADRVLSLLEEESESEELEDTPLYCCRGEIVMDRVDFCYDPKHPLLNGFSLTAKAGERIALVGATGCGKSTIINLLLRFYEIQGGRITLDGISIRDIPRDTLRHQFAMVLQDTWIFSGTVAENIAYGKPNASREEIEAAAKSAHAHSWIVRLPLGYDTPISSNSGLSVGERQLLCIARVMLTSPPILVLDEATSSIDLRTEQRVQRAFVKLMQGRTSFLIAHRLSTIRTADKILMMDSGRILEQGTHEELLASNGAYAKLYFSQFEQEEKAHSYEM